MAQHKHIAPETEAALTDLNEQTLPEISRKVKFNTKSIQDNTASIARLENENRYITKFGTDFFYQREISCHLRADCDDRGDDDFYCRPFDQLISRAP